MHAQRFDHRKCDLSVIIIKGGGSSSPILTIQVLSPKHRRALILPLNLPFYTSITTHGRRRCFLARRLRDSP